MAAFCLFGLRLFTTESREYFEWVVLYVYVMCHHVPVIDGNKTKKFTSSSLILVILKTVKVPQALARSLVCSLVLRGKILAPYFLQRDQDCAREAFYHECIKQILFETQRSCYAVAIQAELSHRGGAFHRQGCRRARGVAETTPVFLQKTAVVLQVITLTSLLCQLCCDAKFPQSVLFGNGESG